MARVPKVLLRGLLGLAVTPGAVTLDVLEGR